MRVLHLAAGNLFGGVETYLLTLARLRDLSPNMEPHFGLCFPGRLRDELLGAGVPVHDLGPVRVSRPWTLFRGRRRLRRLIERVGFDAMITHGCWPHAVFGPVGKRTGIPVVNFIHDDLKGRHWVDRWAARTRPDGVLANSNFTAGTVGTVFPGVVPRVCYLPVTAPATENSESVRQEVRTELLTPDDAVVVLQASRLESWKGHEIHIAALAMLKQRSGWVAWIAGGPQKAGEQEYLAKLVAMAEQSGIADRVRFLGQRSDVVRLMAAADIYCQPNTGPEPFGIVFVEALYSALPVVSADFGGVTEIVTEDCGYQCRPGDAAAVASVLCELIASPARRRALGDAGPARAAELCGPRRQLTRLAEALAESAEVRL